MVLLVAGAATGVVACSGDDDDAQGGRSIVIGFYTSRSSSTRQWVSPW
jgi:hypothetical protein